MGNSRKKLLSDITNSLWNTLSLNAAMFVIGMAAGLLAQSIGLLADALDMLTDATAYVLALIR